jgi:hypothetical protein
MSLSASLFGTDSFIFKATNIMGLGVPGLLHKWFGGGEPEGIKLGEISRQTAKEAEPRVIVWGRVRPIGGNLIHCQEPQKRMVSVSSSGGGKGGGGSKKQKEEHVFRTYAIGVCEGPITGYTRIWRNNKLVYDARGNDWGEENNHVFLGKFRLYLGGWDQMPSPDLEAIWGVGLVPAYRSTAYMVSLDEDLTELGGAVPQWIYEVERAEGTYLTSRPYAVEDIQAASASVSDLKPPPQFRYTDASVSSIAVTGGVLRIAFQSITQDPEAADSAVRLEGGELRNVYVSLDQNPEAADSAVTMTDGELRTALIIYDFYEPEALDSSVTITGGDLS